jgi:hypothetical protein
MTTSVAAEAAAEAAPTREVSEPPVLTIRARLGELAVLGLIPLVVLVALRVSPYFRLNNGDPFIYVGYSNAFSSHVSRFGYTYQAVRFGILFPMRLSLILGPVWGYFVLRYLLYLLAIVPMYAVLRSRGRLAAFAGPMFFIANPVSAQAILSTYHDTFVVPCMSALVAMLILTVRSSGWRLVACAAAAGVLTGWMINSNINATLIAGSASAVAAAALVIARRYRDLAVALGVFSLGVLAVCVAGALVYEWKFGDWDIFETTINAARDVQDAEIWRAPNYSWLSFRRYIYAPWFVVAVGVAAIWRARHRRQSDRELVLAVALLVSVVGFLFAQEFLLQGVVLEQAYYFSPVIGPTALTLGFAIGKLHSVAWPRYLWLGVPAVAAWISQAFELRTFLPFAVLAMLLVGLAIASSRAPLVAAAAVVAAANLAWGAAPRQVPTIAAGHFQYDPHYEIVFGDHDDQAFEAYMLATKLTQLTPTSPGAQPPLLFWYPSFDALLDAAQASFHWETSAVQRAPDPGMPTLEADDIARVRSVVGGYLVLMARTPDVLDAGQHSLREAGFRTVVFEDRQIAYDDSRIYVRVVTVQSAT